VAGIVRHDRRATDRPTGSSARPKLLADGTPLMTATWFFTWSKVMFCGYMVWLAQIPSWRPVVIAEFLRRTLLTSEFSQVKETIYT
jgi:hypothetical protein